MRKRPPEYPPAIQIEQLAGPCTLRIAARKEAGKGSISLIIQECLTGIKPGYL